MNKSQGFLLLVAAFAYWYLRVGAPPRWYPYIGLFALSWYWYIYICLSWEVVESPQRAGGVGE